MCWWFNNWLYDTDGSLCVRYPSCQNRRVSINVSQWVKRFSLFLGRLKKSGWDVLAIWDIYHTRASVLASFQMKHPGTSLRMFSPRSGYTWIFRTQLSRLVADPRASLGNYWNQRIKVNFQVFLASRARCFYRQMSPYWSAESRAETHTECF